MSTSNIDAHAAQYRTPEMHEGIHVWLAVVTFVVTLSGSLVWRNAVDASVHGLVLLCGACVMSYSVHHLFYKRSKRKAAEHAAKNRIQRAAEKEAQLARFLEKK